MSDDKKPERRPFGERSDEERAQPFGGRRATPREEPISPTTPYKSRRPAPPPPPPPAPEPVEEEPDESEVDDQAAEEESYFEWLSDTDPTNAFDAAISEDLPEPPPLPSSIEDSAVLKGRGVPRSIAIPSQSYTEEEDGRRSRRQTQVVIRFSVLFRSIGMILLTAAVVASLFTWWTPNTFLPRASVNQLSVALATQSSAELATNAAVGPPTSTPIPPLRNIGIVAGHSGPNPALDIPDPGAECDDGLTEAEVNEDVALQVADMLRQNGYVVDVLDEFDERLNGYEARAVVSIHADSCQFINEFATGYKVASFSESSAPEEDEKLVECLSSRYAETTGLTFHPSVTFDMTRYHTFREVKPGTPGAIIEIGFLFLDRPLLTGQSDVVALGVVRGILCYLEDGGPTPTPGPTKTPIP